jgi:hypothetical protein
VIHSARSIQVHLQSMSVACSRSNVVCIVNAPADASPETHPETHPGTYPGTSPGRPVETAPSYPLYGTPDGVRESPVHRLGRTPSRTAGDSILGRAGGRQDDSAPDRAVTRLEDSVRDRDRDRAVRTDPDTPAHGPPRAAPEAVGGTAGSRVFVTERHGIARRNDVQGRQTDAGAAQVQAQAQAARTDNLRSPRHSERSEESSLRRPFV